MFMIVSSLNAVDLRICHSRSDVSCGDDGLSIVKIINHVNVSSRVENDIQKYDLRSGGSDIREHAERVVSARKVRTKRLEFQCVDAVQPGHGKNDGDECCDARGTMCLLGTVLLPYGCR